MGEYYGQSSEWGFPAIIQKLQIVLSWGYRDRILVQIWHSSKLLTLRGDGSYRSASAYLFDAVSVGAASSPDPWRFFAELLLPIVK